ncbi:MAG: ATP-binding protein, partial [Candidatus Microsaccharimonas sp.]
MKVLTTGSDTFTIAGNSYALTQIITILLNNALDACSSIPAAEVTTAIDATPTALTISILDNGRGVDPLLQTKLFKPKLSKKATGLGVGLYLAHHLTESVFGGTLEL